MKSKRSRKPNKYKRMRKTRKHKGGYNKDYSDKVIPRIVHQIWFGSNVPENKQFLFDSVKEVCERNGYQYKLWKETDRTRENFPITHPYQQDAIAIGKEIEQNKFAQVADLARLELIYTYGGIYLDSNFLIKDDLLFEIQKMNICKGMTFIGANEDPCELNCANGKGQKYLTNGFFAATKKHIVIKRLIDSDVLDEIDLYSTEVNKTTGPYFLRSGIKNEKKDQVGLFSHDQIYPFPLSGSELRERIENNCLSRTPIEDGIKFSEGQYLHKNCLDIIPPNALAVYLVGLGGSWST